MTLAPALRSILQPAYGPCPGFAAACTEMRWHPEAGHVPRGFFGAAGEATEVELVLVVAEPGDPNAGEYHAGIETAYDYATEAFRAGRDLFHRNVRSIMDMCWPGMSFDQQSRKVWLTESVLCSAGSEGAHVSQRVSIECGGRYLLPQLRLFPDSLIVALGRKARDRLLRLGIDASRFYAASAVAPPEGNKPAARKTWEGIPTRLQSRPRPS